MRVRHAVLLLLLLQLLGGRAKAADSETWLPAAIDHIDRHYSVLVFTDASGTRYVRQLDVQQLRLPVSGGPRYRHASEWYYRADALPEHEIHVDEISTRVHFVRRRRPHIEAPPSADLLLEVIVNSRRLDEPLLLHFEHGEIEFSESALIALGINEEKARLLLKDDDELPVHAIAGENFSLDYSSLTLRMTVPPGLFLPVEIDVAPRVRVPAEPAGGLSAMLGYDITHGIDAERERWNAGLFEFAIGGGTTTCLSQHARLADVEEFRRLDSRCIIDWPDRVLSLNVGDTITRAGAAGQAVRYGGVRFGTDYGLAPQFVTQPSLALLGSARVPSTLEVWIDEMLAVRRDVLPGVFELTDIPVHTGAGEVRAVITNALGMREVISQSFYSDPALLTDGLVDWSIEAGRLREDYALETDSYGERFALLDVRYGVTDWLTIEPRLEAAELFRGAALSAAFRLWDVGVLEVSRAASATETDVRGNASGARFSRRGRYLSFSLAHETSDENFVQLGYSLPGEKPAERSQASIGLALPGGVSLSVGGFRQLLRDDTEQRFHTAALNVPVGRFGSLLLTAFEPVRPLDDPLYALHVTIPFGGRSTFSANTFRQGALEGSQVGVQRNLPAGPGFGYRLTSGETNGAQVDTAELIAQGDVARLRVDGRNAAGMTLGQAQLTGSVILSRSGLDLSRRQDGSAAIIGLPAAGVRVYHDERLAAVTDGDGNAVVPGLRPYQENRLRIESDDLPLDANIELTELRVIPGRRQAVNVDFAVTESRHLSAKLRHARTGKAVPPGALVTLASGESFPVGFDGFIYIPLEGSGATRLHVQWPQGSCQAVAILPASAEPFVDLGGLQCR